MEAGGSAEPPIAPAPWRFFGDFLGVQKVTRRRGGETSLQGTKLLYHRPLIRHGFAVPPSPQGEGFAGEAPGAPFPDGKAYGRPHGAAPTK